jgi:hypothetical protein
VPGLLTSGDVDLHVRADEQWFKPARELLSERYNALKREHEGGSLADYKAAKRDFFRQVVRVVRSTGSIDCS